MSLALWLTLWHTRLSFKVFLNIAMINSLNIVAGCWILVTVSGKFTGKSNAIVSV